MQTCATDDPVEITRLHYGGLGFHGAEPWNERPTAVAVWTSTGANRTDANGTRPRWCGMGGPLGAEWGGLTLMDHPRNPRAPTPVRVHPRMPFFCSMLAQAESFVIQPDRPLVQRYRAVVHAAEPSVGLLDRLWQSFARATDAE